MMRTNTLGMRLAACAVSLAMALGMVPAAASAEAADEAREAIVVAAKGEQPDATVQEGSSMPAFEAERVVDDVTVRVTAPEGTFPEGTELSVERVGTGEQQAADEAVGEVRDEGRNVAASYTFEVKVIDPVTGEEIQPAEGKTVNVSFALAEVADANLETSVYHVSKDDATSKLSAEALDVTRDDEGTATVEADGFSLYTVEFTYGDLQYALPGDSSVAISDILSALGLTGEVTEVEVSDANLFSASNESGEWIVTARRAFSTTERMKVTIGDVAYEITVTDGQDAYHIHTIDGEDVNFAKWESTDSLPTESGSYFLTGDVSLGEAWVIPDGEDINLCLNGHSIKRADNADGKFCLVNVGGYLSTAKLSLFDEDDIGAITGGSGGGVRVDYGSTFTMYSGKIAGNTATDGSGVYITGADSSFVMNGGSIAENSSTGRNGGGVYMNNGSFTMNGGAIQGNTATTGGGVYVRNGSFTMTGGTITDNNTTSNAGGVYFLGGTFTMNGGAIQGNTATTGGGVYVRYGSFTMTGGTITDNNATSNGGGMYVMTSIQVSGSAVIRNNVKGGTLNEGAYTGGTTSNVYLSGSSMIEVANSLDESASIGVTMQTPDVFTNGLDGKGKATNFTSDNTAYAVFLSAGDAGREAALGTSYAVITTDSANGRVSSDKARAAESDTVTLTVVPEAGYSLDNLTVYDEDYKPITVKNNQFTMPGSDVTVTATFKEDQPVCAQVFGHTLTLEGTIGVNTYLVLGDAITSNPSDYQVEFWRGDSLVSSTKVSDVTPTEKSNVRSTELVYGFTVTAVAKEMDAVFTMKIKGPDGTYVDFAGSDGKVVDGGVGLDYAINDYLDDRVAHSENGKMVQLAKDMKAYGTYAKHYFAVRDQNSTDPLPIDDDFQTVEASSLASYAYETPTNIDHFTYKGTTLVLEEDTAFRMYFESDNTSVLTIKRDGAEGAMEIKSGKGAYSGMYYVEVPGIVAKQLDTMYDFTISNDSDSTTAHHGPFGYAYWALSSSDKDSLRYAMMALYHYNQSAKAYFS